MCSSDLAVEQVGSDFVVVPMDHTVDLDRVLRIDPASPVPAAEATRVAEVLRAASDIRSAVQAAAGEVAGERVDQLLGDAARELHLLEVGRAALRATGPAAPSLPMAAPPAAPASGGDAPPGLPAPPR